MDSPAITGLACIELALAWTFFLLGPTACHRPKQVYKPAVLVTRGDVADYVRDALEHEDADVRRKAINHLAETRHAGLPGVVEAMALAARIDESEPVRRAALHALERQGGPIALETCLAILGDPSGESNLRPAGDATRFEAVTALHGLAKSNEWDEKTHLVIRDTAIRLLARDPSRDVRLEAARLLGLYPARESADALVAALRQADFGVVYAAQCSLTHLTGQTFDCDPARWETWLASTQEPFAGAGKDKDADEAKSGPWWWPWG